jgi:arylsulfatase A-like enzyme
MDTTRADHFGFMGNDWIRTPHLDDFASRSIVFEDCMTVVPTTLASHTSLFTGKYPHHHGTPPNGFLVNSENVMLAELLRDAGFHTAGFAGSFALDSRFRFSQGFDHYDETFDQLVGDGGADQNQRSAAAVTDAVIDYLDSKGIPERLFLFVHYFDPHEPYAAPPPYDTAYDPRGREDLPHVAYIQGKPGLSPEGRLLAARRQALQYASEISYMDEQIGRLIDDLEERGILGEALVVLTSDHGENFLEHYRFFNHGFSVYQTTTGAVCVVRPPGRQEGTRVSGPMATIDLMPSALKLLGLPIPDGVDGKSIDLRAPTFEPKARPIFSQATKPWDEVETDPRWANIRKARCIRDGRYKLIQVPYLGVQELYDLIEDPLESTDLLAVGAPPALVERLSRDLEAWAESANPLPSRFDPGQQEETIRRLRSLGYLN